MGERDSTKQHKGGKSTLLINGSKNQELCFGLWCSFCRTHPLYTEHGDAAGCSETQDRHCAPLVLWKIWSPKQKRALKTKQKKKRLLGGKWVVKNALCKEKRGRHMKPMTRSVVQLCLTLQPNGLQPSRLLCPWDSPGKNAGERCHFLLQRIFLTQESNRWLPRLVHWHADFLPLWYLGNSILGHMAEKLKSYIFTSSFGASGLKPNPRVNGLEWIYTWVKNIKTLEDFGQRKLIITGFLFYFPKKRLASFVLRTVTLRQQENVSSVSVDTHATAQSQT